MEKVIEKGIFFDIIFLDIQFDDKSKEETFCKRKKNGIEIGQKIRNIYNDQKTQMVYISSYESYAIKLFQNHPFDFVIKPLTEEKIYHVLNQLIRLYFNGEQKFEYNVNGIIYEEKIQNILYFRSNLRKIEMVTIEGIKLFHGKIKELMEKVTLRSFIRIHQSYFINPQYIEKVKDKIIIINGEELPISRKYMTSFKEQLRKNMMKKVGKENELI
ncbi:MAG: LytR/AlgR family response regulator transcription factor [Candidatus Fimimorpha sp.]